MELTRDKIKTVTQYRTTDGTLHETLERAQSVQRVLNWQASFTQDENLDFNSTLTLQDLFDWITARMFTHGSDAKVQFRASELEEVTVHLKKAD